MIFVKDQIESILRRAVVKAFDITEPVSIRVEYPTEESHGDYASAVALTLSKPLKKSPREVAEKIVDAIEKTEGISAITIAGPGFINFSMSPWYLSHITQVVIKEGDRFGKSEIGKGKTIVTDSSHPNVAKPMGIHHLLSTIIGDSLNKTFAALGYTLIRDNYLGDWGTQFGKLIYAYKKWGDKEAVKKNPIPELLKLYVKFHDEIERLGVQNQKDADALEELGRAEFKKLEDGDTENRELWTWVVALSVTEFEKIWKRLGVSFDFIHGESFYEDKMQAIIEMGIKKKVFTDGERGALIAPFNHEKYPPAIIRKSDGATMYATRDLARVKYWEDTWHPDLMVNIVDVAQQMYFMQLFEVTDMLGLTDAKNIHVEFGRMSFPEKKMSTRKGNIILLEDVLDEAEERAYQIVNEKNPNLSEEKKRVIARQVGIGALKYAVLCQNRNTNITFTWDKMLSLEGNTAPYLQYVYARACSILRKAGMSEGQDTEAEKINHIDDVKNYPYKFILPQEAAIARMFPKFAEVIAKAGEEFKPNLIANYIYELAGRFNSFYGAVQVLNEEDTVARQSRLALVKAVTIILKNGLDLLGIEAPEEM